MAEAIAGIIVLAGAGYVGWLWWVRRRQGWGG
jgi:hypothetical protein